MRGRAKVFYFISMRRLIKNLISPLAVVILTAGVAVARQPAEAADALLAKLKTRTIASVTLRFHPMASYWRPGMVSATRAASRSGM